MDRNMITPAAHAKAAITFRNSRFNLLLLVAFTLVNIILVIAKSDMYFLFSATVPYYLAVYGLFWTGHLPDEVPEGQEIQYLSDSFLVVMLVIAAVILVLYLLFFFLSKKHYGFLIAALVFFAIDCVYMAYTIFSVGFEVSSLIDLAFHAWVLYYLISGVIAGVKLRKPVMPIEEAVAGTEGQNQQ